MKRFIFTSILISSACVSSVFADEVSTPVHESSTPSASSNATNNNASSSDSSGSSGSESSDFQNFRRHRQASNKRWFQYGVCVGQNLAQQGVVISAGQQLDSSYADHIKAAKEACGGSVKPSASPSATPSVEASPSPSPTVTPSDSTNSGNST